MSNRQMAIVVDNTMCINDEGYNHYGTAVVNVRNTETGDVRTESVDYAPSKSKGDAIAEAIQRASDK